MNGIFEALSLQVTNEILDKFIATKTYLAVLFYREDDDASTSALKVPAKMTHKVVHRRNIFSGLNSNLRNKPTEDVNRKNSAENIVHFTSHLPTDTFVLTLMEKKLHLMYVT